MPLPVIPDVFRCTLNWAAGSGIEYMHNVIHLANTVGDEAAVFADLDSHVTAAMWNTAPSGFAVQTVDVLKLDGTSATVSFATGRPAKWTGSGTGQWIPAAAEIITLYSPFRGRSNRGRVYLPMSEGVQDSGSIDPAITAAAQAAWEAFRAAMAADTSPLYIASYTIPDAVACTSVLARSLLGTQRRRQQALGIA